MARKLSETMITALLDCLNRPLRTPDGDTTYQVPFERWSTAKALETRGMLTFESRTVIFSDKSDKTAQSTAAWPTDDGFTYLRDALAHALGRSGDDRPEPYRTWLTRASNAEAAARFLLGPDVHEIHTITRLPHEPHPQRETRTARDGITQMANAIRAGHWLDTDRHGAITVHGESGARWTFVPLTKHVDIKDIRRRFLDAMDSLTRTNNTGSLAELMSYISRDLWPAIVQHKYAPHNAALILNMDKAATTTLITELADLGRHCAEIWEALVQRELKRRADAGELGSCPTYADINATLRAVLDTTGRPTAEDSTTPHPASASAAWVESGSMIEDAGEIGGDIQIGAAPQRRFLHTTLHGRVIDVTAYPIKGDGRNPMPPDDAPIRLQMQIQMIICRDVEDPGGTEEFDAIEYPALPEAYSGTYATVADAEADARRLVSAFDPAAHIEWDGRPDFNRANDAPAHQGERILAGRSEQEETDADEPTPLDEMGTDDLLTVLRAHQSDVPADSTFGKAWKRLDEILTNGGRDCLPWPWDHGDDDEEAENGESADDGVSRYALRFEGDREPFDAYEDLPDAQAAMETEVIKHIQDSEGDGCEGCGSAHTDHGYYIEDRRPSQQP